MRRPTPKRRAGDRKLGHPYPPRGGYPSSGCRGPERGGSRKGTGTPGGNSFIFTRTAGEILHLRGKAAAAPSLPKFKVSFPWRISRHQAKAAPSSSLRGGRSDRKREGAQLTRMAASTGEAESSRPPAGGPGQAGDRCVPRVREHLGAARRGSAEGKGGAESEGHREKAL